MRVGGRKELRGLRVVPPGVFFAAGEGCMPQERDVAMLWRKLLSGHDVTPEKVAEAQALLDGLSPENPLRMRLTRELDELGALHRRGTRTSNSSPENTPHGERQKHVRKALARGREEAKGRRKTGAP
jgi:hypothetical protein